VTLHSKTEVLAKNQRERKPDEHCEGNDLVLGTVEVVLGFLVLVEEWLQLEVGDKFVAL
jgi:hypothetical protein